MNHQRSTPAPKRSRRGIALLLTLGIVALLLIIAMGFAFSARQESQYARVNADYAQANLLAQSGVQRIMGMLARELGGAPDFYPREKFYEETTTTDNWFRRTLLGSINSDVTYRGYSVDSALWIRLNSNVATSGWNYTPANNDTNATLENNVAWEYISFSTDTSAAGSGPTGYQYIGRVAWLLFDDTGKIDPGAIVDPLVLEENKVRTGASVREVSLRNVFSTLPKLADSFMNDSQTGTGAGGPGYMPRDQQWYSLLHIFTGNPEVSSQARADSVVNTIFPYSVTDPEEFLLNVNDDSDSNRYDAGTDTIVPRLDLASLTVTSAPAIYDFLVGYPFNSTRDDAKKFSPWLKAVARSQGIDPNSGGITAAQKRLLRRIAAQQAINMTDWQDADANDIVSSLPPVYYEDAAYVRDASFNYDLWLNTNFNAYFGMFGGVNNGPATASELTTKANNLESIAYGTENTCGLSELAWRITAVRAGDDVSLKPEFRVEVFQPFSTADYTVSLQMTYTVALQCPATGSSWTGQYVVQLANAGAAIAIDSAKTVFDSGAMYFTDQSGGYLPGNVLVGGNPPYNAAGLMFGAAAGDTWAMDVTIDSMDLLYLKNAAVNYRRVRHWPVNVNVDTATGSLTVYSRFIKWTNLRPTAAGGSDTFYVRLAAKDPLYADRDGQDSSFTSYWDLDPATATDLSSDQWAKASDKGGTVGNTGTPAPGLGYYAVGAKPYCAPAPPPDAAFTRLYELGRLHSPYLPNQSVKLWSATVAAWPNDAPDTRLLDMFRASGTAERGKISANTRSFEVARALFTGVATNAGIAAGALLANNAPPDPFTFRGDVGRIYSNVALAAAEGFTAAASDSAAEFQLGKFVELLDVRNQYYTAIVTGQALRDTRDGTMPQNGVAFPSGRNGIVLAEQRAMVIFYRDAYTRHARIVWFARLED